MTKIEEIKERIILEGGYTDYEECIDLCMKEYAEFYTKQCLVIAAKEACVVCLGNDGIENYYNVDRDSILNLRFPSHDGTVAYRL